MLDIALAVFSAMECAARGQGFAQQTGIPELLGVALGVVGGASLVLRRRWPIAVVLVAIALMPADMGTMLGVVGLYTLAATEVPRRITGLLAAMMAVGMLVMTVVRLQQNIGSDPNFDPAAWFVPLIAVLMSVGVTAPPVLLGLYVGARRRLVESLRERADGLERELSLLADRAEERAEWARNEERTRIAREMHDVVAHRVSLMVVHAAALQAVALKDPEKASRNAALVGDMGRQALDELRTMLGVLRSGEREERPAGGGAVGPGSASASGRESEPGSASDSASDSGSGSGSGSWADRGSGSGSGSGAGSEAGAGERAVPGADEVPVRLAEFASAAAGRVAAGALAAGAAGAERRAGDAGEAPSLGELEVLVGQSRAAGMAVELRVDGKPGGDCPPSVEQVAYRVVQEALTNVHKHAAGARTWVRVAHREAEVALQVENASPSAGAADAGLPSGGNGLVGMRERVMALGGGFVSGPTDAGGFRVSAIIPYVRP